MNKGYYFNDKKINYCLFKDYLYKTCKFIILDNADSVNSYEVKHIEELAIEKMNELFNKMKNEDAIIEYKKLKFEIIK